MSASRTSNAIPANCILAFRSPIPTTCMSLASFLPLAMNSWQMHVHLILPPASLPLACISPYVYVPASCIEVCHLHAFSPVACIPAYSIPFLAYRSISRICTNRCSTYSIARCYLLLTLRKEPIQVFRQYSKNTLR
jgi:hypothetical protein